MVNVASPNLKQAKTKITSSLFLGPFNDFQLSTSQTCRGISASVEVKFNIDIWRPRVWRPKCVHAMRTVWLISIWTRFPQRVSRTHFYTTLPHLHSIVCQQAVEGTVPNVIKHSMYKLSLSSFALPPCNIWPFCLYVITRIKKKWIQSYEILICVF